MVRASVLYTLGCRFESCSLYLGRSGETAATIDLKSIAFGRAGSNPASGIILNHAIIRVCQFIPYFILRALADAHVIDGG